MQDIHELMLRALDPLLRRFEALSPLFVTALEIVYDHPGETVRLEQLLHRVMRTIPLLVLEVPVALAHLPLLTWDQVEVLDDPLGVEEW